MTNVEKIPNTKNRKTKNVCVSANDSLQKEEEEDDDTKVAIGYYTV